MMASITTLEDIERRRPKEKSEPIYVTVRTEDQEIALPVESVTAPKEIAQKSEESALSKFTSSVASEQANQKATKTAKTEPKERSAKGPTTNITVKTEKEEELPSYEPKVAFGERQEIQAPVIGGNEPPLLQPAVPGETPHLSLNALRMKQLQLVVANPLQGGQFSFSDFEKNAMLPVASELVNLERQKKQISPDINSLEEFQALESPSGDHDAAIWLDMILDGSFGDTLKDQMLAIQTHVATSADESFHHAAIGENPVVRQMNENGNVLVRQDTNFGDAFQTFQSAEEVKEARPEMDLMDIDHCYTFDGVFRVPMQGLESTPASKRGRTSQLERIRKKTEKIQEKTALIDAKTNLVNAKEELMSKQENARAIGNALRYRIAMRSA